MIKAIIVDDERLAREELKYMLRTFPDVEIQSEARNSTEAKSQIESLKPDLLFLDISMPQKNGFELLEELSHLPKIIFVTAHDQYAVKAFEKNALDFLVKPTNNERLAKTIAKVKKEIELEKSNYSEAHQQIFLKDGDQCYLIPYSSIYLIESVGNYSKFLFDTRFCLMHRSLSHVESKVPSSLFFRANRKHIINMNFVVHINSEYKGGIEVTLMNEMKIEISVRNAVKFKRIMGI